uniref:Uncharacterized protein n=1 Tax=Cannabis sativa TaxID=3483 RepID=A0A803P2T6_CANSA
MHLLSGSQHKLKNEKLGDVVNLLVYSGFRLFKSIAIGSSSERPFNAVIFSIGGSGGKWDVWPISIHGVGAKYRIGYSWLALWLWICAPVEGGRWRVCSLAAECGEGILMATARVRLMVRADGLFIVPIIDRVTVPRWRTSSSYAPTCGFQSGDRESRKDSHCAKPMVQQHSRLDVAWRIFESAVERKSMRLESFLWVP